MGGPSEQHTGGQPPQQMGGQQGQMRSQQAMGGQPQGQPSDQPPGQMGAQSGQPMGAQSGQAMGPQSGQSMAPTPGQSMGGTQPLRIPIEPVGAEDVAATDVVTASRDDPLTSIVEQMADEDVGTVVITDDDRPIGIITDRKIALTLAEHPDVSEMTAGDVMTEDPVTVTTETNVFEVIQTFGDAGIRRTPIVDNDGKLTGIVSTDDMLVLLATELDQLGEMVERQIDRF